MRFFCFFLFFTLSIKCQNINVNNDFNYSLIRISTLNGDLKSVLYYLEKLPDDWKVGLKNFISKCKLFLAKENG